MLFDFALIGNDVKGVDDEHCDQQNGAKAHSGKQRHSGDVLSHAHGKGIHQTGGESGSGAHRNHRHAGYLVKAKRQRHGDSDGNEDGNLIGHAHGGSEDGKKGQEHGNHKNFLALQLFSDGSAEGENGAACVHQFKGASDDHQERDHIDRLQNTLIHHAGNAQKADRIGAFRGVASRFHHGSAGYRIFIAHKLAGRNDIGGCRRQDDQTHDDHQSMGSSQFFLFLFHNFLLIVLRQGAHFFMK